ncbi:MAG: hypothetical protein WD690_12750 [Vicinamibacterales bacterium]
MNIFLRPAATVLVISFALPQSLWAAMQSSQTGASQQQQTPPPQPPQSQQLPVDMAKIREALKQDPKLRLNTDELRFYVSIIGRIPTFEEIVGDFDLRNGQVPGAPMTHDEFLAMVTPKDLHSTTGISALETLGVALTSWGMISMVKRAYEEYKQARTERERRAIQERIERELRELERRRSGGR